MHFLGNLGIDPSLLVAQVVNFALLVWLLARFLYRLIVERIEKDEHILTKAKEREEELAKREQTLERKEKQITTRAKNKAERIIADAESVADDIKERAAKESAREREALVAQVRERVKELEEHGAV